MLKEEIFGVDQYRNLQFWGHHIPRRFDRLTAIDASHAASFSKTKISKIREKISKILFLSAPSSKSGVNIGVDSNIQLSKKW